MWRLMVPAMVAMAAASVSTSEEETRLGAQTGVMKHSQRACEQLDRSSGQVPLNISSSQCL